MQFSQEALKEAMREVEEIQRKQAVEMLWDDELYEFISANRPHPHSRSTNKLTWEQLFSICQKHNLCNYTRAEALRVAFKREEIRRNLLEGNNG